MNICIYLIISNFNIYILISNFYIYEGSFDCIYQIIDVSFDIFLEISLYVIGSIKWRIVKYFLMI